jgi:hypothetical protein
MAMNVNTLVAQSKTRAEAVDVNEVTSDLVGGFWIEDSS